MRRNRTVDAELTSAQEQAVGLLASGGRTQDVAEQVGVDRRTLWSWTKSPAFQSALRERRRALSDQISAAVLERATSALDVLGELAGESEKDADRVRAAAAILGSALKVVARVEDAEQARQEAAELVLEVARDVLDDEDFVRLRRALARG